MNPEIFREYDIRGLADKDFNTAFSENLGRAVGTLLSELGEHQIAVGRDCRLSSEKYTRSLIKGLAETGTQVIVLGICPTPLVYFAIFHEGFHNGISVTGSHNPAEFNGFKISIQNSSIYGPAIQDLKRRIENRIFKKAEKAGQLTSLSIIPLYTDYVTQNISLKKSLKVVVDAGNAAAGPVAPGIFRNLGCEVIELFCEMDGRFPNHHPDPTLPENLEWLIQKVKAEKADLGIAFDGDADRLSVVDDQGRILWGDQLMMLYSKAVLKALPGGAIIGEVKCSQHLFSEIKKWGGRPIMWKTGHSLIKAKMREERALLAGEMSGHIFFADRYYGYDDGIYAAARLLEMLSLSDRSLSAYLSELPKSHSTPEIRVACSDQRKFEIVKKAQKYFSARYKTTSIDGVRIEFSDGWALIRASNTQPVLVLRFEASTPERLSAIRSLVETKLKEFQ